MRHDLVLRFGFIVLASVVCSVANAVETSTVSFENARYGNERSTTITGQLKTPAGAGPFPAVLVLQACGGLDDNVTVDWPDYLVQLGYAALIIDILGSRRVVNACSGEPIPLDERMRDVYGAISFLSKHPMIDSGRIYAVGFSWGGTHVLEAALQRRLPQFAGGVATLKGGIAVYPGCIGIHRAVTERGARPVFYTPVLIIAAERDNWTPVKECQTIISGQRMPGRVRMEVLPGAHHGFDQFTQRGLQLTRRSVMGHTMAPDRAATDKARALVKAFLEKPE